LLLVCCCRDFLVCVVGSPAVLAGNSIGGFISASAAADYPSLVAGLALLNSAGVWGNLVGTGWGQPFQSKAKQTCSPQDKCMSLVKKLGMRRVLHRLHQPQSQPQLLRCQLELADCK
jgi:pimeloyl-ACP methyl ester carboxylesterase